MAPSAYASSSKDKLGYEPSPSHPPPTPRRSKYAVTDESRGQSPDEEEEEEGQISSPSSKRMAVRDLSPPRARSPLPPSRSLSARPPRDTHSHKHRSRDISPHSSRGNRSVKGRPSSPTSLRRSSHRRSPSRDRRQRSPSPPPRRHQHHQSPPLRDHYRPLSRSRSPSQDRQWDRDDRTRSSRSERDRDHYDRRSIRERDEYDHRSFRRRDRDDGDHRSLRERERDYGDDYRRRERGDYSHDRSRGGHTEQRRDDRGRDREADYYVRRRDDGPSQDFYDDHNRERRRGESSSVKRDDGSDHRHRRGSNAQIRNHRILSPPPARTTTRKDTVTSPPLRFKDDLSRSANALERDADGLAQPIPKQEGHSSRTPAAHPSAEAGHRAREVSLSGIEERLSSSLPASRHSESLQKQAIRPEVEIGGPTSKWSRATQSSPLSDPPKINGIPADTTSSLSLQASSGSSIPIPTGPRAQRGLAFASLSHAVPTGPKAFAGASQVVKLANQSPPAAVSPKAPTTPTAPDGPPPPPSNELSSQAGQMPPPPPTSQLQPPPPPPPPPAESTQALTSTDGGAAEEKTSGWKTVYDPKAQEKIVTTTKKPKEAWILASGSDPRTEKHSWRKHVRHSKRPARQQLSLVTWKWDKNSTGPKPPPLARAILVTGLSPLASVAALLSHFRQFGRTDRSELKTDPKTGESLGIYWHKFAHDFQERDDAEGDGPLLEGRAPPGQHGHQSALNAIKESNGQRIGVTTASFIAKVELDGEQQKYIAAYRETLRKRYEKKNKAEAAASPHNSVPNGTSPVSSSPRHPVLSPIHASSTGRAYNAQQHLKKPSPFTQPVNDRSSASPSARQYAERRQPSRRDGSLLREDSTSRYLEAENVYHNWSGEQRYNGRTPIHDTASSTPGEMSLSGRYTPRTSISLGRGDDGSESGMMITSQLAGLGYPYIFLPHAKEGTTEHGLANIRQHFRSFSPRYIACDEFGWYIGFDSQDAASRSKFVCDRSTIAGIKIDVEVREAPEMTDELHKFLDEEEQQQNDKASRDRNAAQVDHGKLKPPIEDDVGKFRPEHVMAHRRMTSGYTEAELVEEAERIIFRDLEEDLRRDCRSRIIVPHIAEFLRDDGRGGIALREAVEVANRSASSDKMRRRDGKDALGSDFVAEDSTMREVAGDQLPSFRRKREATPPPPRYVGTASYEAMDKAKMIERGRKARAAFVRELSVSGSSMSPTLVSPAAADEGQEDEETTSTAADPEDHEEESRMHSKSSRKTTVKGNKDKKDAKARSAKTIVYSSDEDGQSATEAARDKVELDDRRPAKKTAIAPVAKAKGAQVSGKNAKSKPKAKKVSERLPAPSISASATPELPDLPEDASLQARVEAEEAALAKLAGAGMSKKSKTAKSSAAKAGAVSLEPVDPFISGLAEDEEDLYYLRQALERLRAGEIVTPASIPDDPEEEELPQITPNDDDDGADTIPLHQTGSARTEGFYKIPPAQKAAHLPDRNKAIAETTTNVTLASARDNRADSRRLVLGIEQHKKDTASDTDILKFNQLRTRKKQLKFAKSPIHDWGLYAMEYIPANDMVIEYVGEVIRQQVADHREKLYEKQGNFSTYLFRVDDDLVVDATHKGNIARLMNHCCVPNCSAKILTLNGQKRIVLYAKTAILPGQELTYDYKFQSSQDEEDAIACLCGAEGCRRFL